MKCQSSPNLSQLKRFYRHAVTLYDIMLMMSSCLSKVTAVFFAVRNYWRGFFSSVIGSIFFRLISVWLGEIDTLIAVFPTGFSVTFPFDVLEIYMFILIGIVCGFGGAFYVYSHRR